MQIRSADMQDLPAVLALYNRARAFMAANGNPTQWGNGEPGREMAEADIAAGRSWICEENGQILATFMFAPGPDPMYENAQSQWLNDEPYWVLHRIAASGERRGTGSFCICWAFAQCGNLRIDTHRSNHPMRHLLEKLGFQPCGHAAAPDGTDRLTYQRYDSAVCRSGSAPNHSEEEPNGL